MRESIKAILEKSGHDTGKYLSLRINKGDLPQGSEVVIMVRDAKTGAVRPISTEQKSENMFACKSRFYNQVMEDGHLFNPYIHRRFIAAQFRRLIMLYGCEGIKRGIAKSYTWDYAIGILCKEVHKLANLWKHDRYGYAERSMFFTLEKCADVIADYAEAVALYIDDSFRGRDHAYLPGYGTLLKANARPMKYRFMRLAEQAKDYQSYKQMDNLLSAFDWLSLPKEQCLPDSFVEPFAEEGAYYTLKHHMMFEGLRMYGQSQKDSLKSLRKYGGDFLMLYQNIME